MPPMCLALFSVLVIISEQIRQKSASMRINLNRVEPIVNIVSKFSICEKVISAMENRAEHRELGMCEKDK